MTFPSRVAAVLLCVVTACGGSHHGSAPSTSGSIITRQELDQAGSVTAYDAVLRLRPAFLRDRGKTSVMNSAARTRATVFLNEAEYGAIESLKQISASRVQEIRFYSGPEATTRFGSAFGSGIIMVTMRTQ